MAGPKMLQKQLNAPEPRQNELQVMQPDAKSKLQDGGNWASHKAGEASRQQGSDFQSMLVRSLYGNPQMFNTLDLIEYADQLNDKFSETTKEEVRKAYAISLVGIYRELQRREDSAPRNYDNALMAQIDGRLVPWTQNNAKELQQIWPFALENLAEWFIVAGESNLSFAKAVIKPSEAATTRSLMGKQEQTMYEKASDPIGPLLRSEQQTFMLGLGQQLTAGDEDIKSGLNCLSSITVGDLRAVLNTELKGVRKKDDNGDRLKLIETAGVVYYVTDDRAYQIDRTGHIVPDNVFTLRASTLKPGAVYYIGMFSSSRGQKEIVLPQLFRVDAHPRVEEGDIYFRYLNTEYLRHIVPTVISTTTPKQNDEGYFIASAGGVAIIAAPKEDRLLIDEFSRNFDWRLGRTFERVFHHLYWASQLAVMTEIEDKKRILSGQIATDDVINLVHRIANKHPMLKTISAFLNGIQEVEWGAKIYKAIKRAKGNDELDLAAQMIALRMASDALGHAKGKVLNKAKVVAKKVREERSAASTANVNVKEVEQPAPRTAALVKSTATVQNAAELAGPPPKAAAFKAAQTEPPLAPTARVGEEVEVPAKTMVGGGEWPAKKSGALESSSSEIQRVHLGIPQQLHYAPMQNESGISLTRGTPPSAGPHHDIEPAGIGTAVPHPYSSSAKEGVANKVPVPVPIGTADAASATSGVAPVVSGKKSGASFNSAESLAETAKRLAQEPPGPPGKFSPEVGRVHAFMQEINSKLTVVKQKLGSLEVDIKKKKAEIDAANQLMEESKLKSKANEDVKWLSEQLEVAKKEVADANKKKSNLQKDKQKLEEQLENTLAKLEIVVKNREAYETAQDDYCWALIEKGEKLAGQRILVPKDDTNLAKPRMDLSTKQIEEVIANLDKTTRELIEASVPSKVPGGLILEALENAGKISKYLLANNKPIDVVTGKPIKGKWQPDHIVSRNRISADPRFKLLLPSQQRKMFNNIPKNMFPLSDELKLNWQKGDRTIAEWIALRKRNKDQPIKFEKELIDAEKLAWKEIDEMFIEFLGPEKGKSPGALE